jgi:hypothetical protein
MLVFSDRKMGINHLEHFAAISLRPIAHDSIRPCRICNQYQTAVPNSRNIDDFIQKQQLLPLCDSRRSLMLTLQQMNTWKIHENS